MFRWIDLQPKDLVQRNVTIARGTRGVQAELQLPRKPLLPRRLGVRFLGVDHARIPEATEKNEYNGQSSAYTV